MKRAARLVEVARLQADGQTPTQIGRALGISRSYANALCQDPTGQQERARKARYAGTCQDCGGPTDGSNGRAQAPSRCASCQRAFQRSDAYRPPTYRWTPELLLARLREWAELHGSAPTTTDWLATTPEQGVERYWPTPTTVIRVYGSWPAGVRAAGLTPRDGRREPRHTQETALQAIRAWSEAHGGAPPTIRAWSEAHGGAPPTIRAWSEARQRPSSGSVKALFGSWNAAIVAAGLTPSYRTSPGKGWTRELILRRLRAWNAAYGSPPVSTDWNPHTARKTGQEWRAERFADGRGYWPGYQAVYKYFGSWGAALERAGLR